MRVDEEQSASDDDVPCVGDGPPPPAHAFAFTHGDGSRQYGFCKLLGPSEALLLVAAEPHSALYLGALEQVAAATGAASATLHLLPGLRTSPASSTDNSARYFTSHPMRGASRRSAIRCTADADPAQLSAWLAHSLHTLTASPNTLHNDDPLLLHTSLVGDDTDVEASFDGAWSLPAPRGAAPALPPPPPPPHALSDPSAVQLLTPRALVCVLSALLDERRVAVVGACASTVSRVVLALAAILRPFEWPHLLSPTLPRRHAPVLAAPFPYLVGVCPLALADARTLPLDEVLLVNIDSHDIEPIGEPFTDLFRAIPRTARARLERRLARVRADLPPDDSFYPRSHDNDEPARSRKSRSAGPSIEAPRPRRKVQSAPHTSVDTGLRRKIRTTPHISDHAPSLRWKARSAPHPSTSVDTPWLEAHFSEPVERACVAFYAELVESDVPAASERKRRHRSFVARRAQQTTQNTLQARFRHTQMFLQWQASPDAQQALLVGRKGRRRARRDPNSIACLLELSDCEDNPSGFADRVDTDIAGAALGASPKNQQSNGQTQAPRSGRARAHTFLWRSGARFAD